MRLITATMLLAGVAAIRPSIARADAPDPRPVRDLGTEVRGVFAAKCAACHGADLAKPKGRFGYVLDLQRVAGNREMIVPSRPDESELWVLVQRNEMPPADSAHGPLTEKEKETVRAWIAAGAPDVAPPSSGESPTAELEPPTAPAYPAPPLVQRAIRLLGKFHLVLLHFPIALVFAACVEELLAARRGSQVPSPAVGFCLLLAALTIVPTVALGWLHAEAGNGIASPQLLAAHRWLGTLTGAWVIGTAFCAWRDAHRGARGGAVRVGLALGLLLVLITAHAGGLLVHGRDFFEW